MDVTELTKTIIDEIIDYYENEEFTCPISKDVINEPMIITTSGQTYDKSSLDEYVKFNNNNKVIDEPILKKYKFKPSTDIIKNYAFKNAIEKNHENINKKILRVLNIAKNNKSIFEYITNSNFLLYIEVIKCIIENNMIYLYLNNSHIMNYKTLNILFEYLNSNKISVSDVTTLIKILIKCNNINLTSNEIKVDIIINLIKKNKNLTDDGSIIAILSNQIVNMKDNIENLNFIFDIIPTEVLKNISNNVINSYNVYSIDDNKHCVKISYLLLKATHFVLKNNLQNTKKLILEYCCKYIKNEQLKSTYFLLFIENLLLFNEEYYNEVINDIFEVLIINNFTDITKLNSCIFILFYNLLSYHNKKIFIGKIKLTIGKVNNNKENTIINILSVEHDNYLLKTIKKTVMGYLKRSSLHNKNIFKILVQFHKNNDKKFSEKEILKIIFKHPENAIKNSGLDMLSDIYDMSDNETQNAINEIANVMCENHVLKKHVLANNGINFIIKTMNNSQDILVKLCKEEPQLFIENNGFDYLDKDVILDSLKGVLSTTHQIIKK